LYEIIGKCQFNEIWVGIGPWVEKTGGKLTPRWALCMENIDIAALGEAALKSHAKSNILYSF